MNFKIIEDLYTFIGVSVLVFDNNDVFILNRLCGSLDYEYTITIHQEAHIKSKYNTLFIIKEQGYYFLYHMSIFNEYDYHLECRKKVVQFLIERIQRHDRHLEIHGRNMSRGKLKKRSK